ncbi:MAG: S9 family peptidase [Verrucomicrobia bacterium]|nr:S9 family peptidase [Verrucomicrobiota bacterium]
MAAFACCAAGRGGELPVEYFFKEYAFSNMKISPTGKYLATVMTEKTNHFLLTVEIVSRQKQIACSGEIADYEWVSDDRLVVFGGGWHSGGMFAVDRNGANVKVLVDAALTQVSRRWLRFYHVLENSAKDFPFILVESSEIDLQAATSFRRPTVRRVNVLNGKSEVVEKNPGDVLHWHTDLEGRVRLATAQEKERVRLLYRDQRGQPWQPVLDYDIWEEYVGPVRFAPDNRRFYAVARQGHDTLGLYLFDPATKAFADCLWRHDRFDLASVRFGADKAELVGAVYEGDRRECHYLNDKARRRFQSIDAALPGLVKIPIEDTEDRLKTLFFAYSDRMPGAYYVHHSDRNELELFAEVAPWIKPDELSEMKPITYTARDGLQIHGYLTLPRGREPKALPLIVMPHGGPWVRDVWGFDPEVQFLANRGYAVLQPNYRSSEGYGLAFEKAGYKQYGLKIQDDITDGVKWAIGQGLADPARICIFGCSFGGYAAMVGLTQTPELYRCGINYAGLTDLNRQLRKVSARASKLAQTFARMAIGDHRKEKELLRDVSPVNHVANIRAPVMLIYGGADPVVDIEQGRKLEKELKAKGKPHEFVYEQSEGHGFRSQTNLFKLYNRIDAFLQKHMK